MTGLPAHALAEVQRILDAEARRLLADQLDRDPAVATTGSEHDAVDGGADQGAASVQRQAVPVVGGVDRDEGPVAA